MFSLHFFSLFLYFRLINILDINFLGISCTGKFVDHPTQLIYIGISICRYIHSRAICYRQIWFATFLLNEMLWISQNLYHFVWVSSGIHQVQIWWTEVNGLILLGSGSCEFIHCIVFSCSLKDKKGFPQCNVKIYSCTLDMLPCFRYMAVLLAYK